MKKQTIQAIVAVLVALGLYAYYSLSQLYTQDSTTTATSGVLFTKTLNLTAYKQISDGKNFMYPIMGKFVNYSRSDRHNELVTVYCGEYCPKDK